MGKKEGKIENGIRDYAIDRDFKVRKYVTPGHRGAPDRIFYGHGVVFWIETKTPDGTLSADQKREIRYLRAAGMLVFVVDNMYAGCQIVDDMLKLKKVSHDRKERNNA